MRKPSPKPDTKQRPKLISCGVLVTDGLHLLLGHATGSPRWDVPKGLVEPGEELVAAAIRELEEETGLCASPADLADLGRHPYRPNKDLALFVWQREAMPDPATLTCASTFVTRWGETRPEFDRFAVLPRAEVTGRIAGSLAAVLARIGWLE